MPADPTRGAWCGYTIADVYGVCSGYAIARCIGASDGAAIARHIDGYDTGSFNVCRGHNGDVAAAS